MSKFLHGQMALERVTERVQLTEYAQMKKTLADCKLIFKMADPGDKHMGMFPLTTRQFSATFLDFQRNSRGYNDKVESADQDVTKRLLNPFLPEFEVFPIPQCHRFGKAMWAFAKQCTAIQRQSTNQNTDLTLPPCRLNSEEDLQVTPSRVDEPPRSSELPHEPTPTSCNIPELNEQPNVEELCTGPLKSNFTDTAAWNGASKIRTTSNGTDQNKNTVISEFPMSQNSDFHLLDCLQQQFRGSCKEVFYEAHVDDKLSTSEAVSNRSSSHFENYVELGNLEPRITLSTDCHPENDYEKRVDIHGGSESKHDDLLSGDEKCVKTKKNVKTEECVASMLENKDVTKDQNLCDAMISEKQNTVMLDESLHKKSHIMPLPLYKKGNHSNIPISKSLTINLNLDALLSVLHSEKKTVKYAEHDGSIYGKVAVLYGFQQNTSVSVLQAEMVGWYDYISGTVNGLQQGLCHDNTGSQVENNTLQVKQ
ncbi:uncharacterized protein LOC110046855 [Orbicella faveolata]|uniref:uncharacterized protein LOC110046855 n=1 Tax=Orbicella faveolata TaxID=48498 RepID=UPI0009E2B428|nr:uncharacterized protein LOC110046855 [Orbicella faveolata]